MTYDDIQGWFDFADLYDEQVRVAKEGSRFVEVGAWLGKSTAYLAARIKDSGKAIRLDAVDSWRGGTDGPVNHPTIVQTVAARGGSVYDDFVANMRACGVADLVNPIREDSTAAASRYPDASLDFVFVDADHAYERVAADLAAWWPKIKSGGVLAGHDFDEDGPHRAASEFAESERLPVVKLHRSFYFRKPAAPPAKVFIALPNYGLSSPKCCLMASTQATRGTHKIQVHTRESSLLCSGFNHLWAEALESDCSHFAMVHADIQPEQLWLDLLLEEMHATETDMLGVVSPIKDHRGLTSIGIAHADRRVWWSPHKRFTMQEICKLPPTFDAALAGFPDHSLLLNTGLWLADLRNPAWRTCDADGRLAVYFNIRDGLVARDGKLVTCVQSEDWFFSVRAADAGLRLACTRKCEVQHYGPFGWPNNVPWGKWDTDHTTAENWQTTESVCQ